MYSPLNRPFGNCYSLLSHENITIHMMPFPTGTNVKAVCNVQKWSQNDIKTILNTQKEVFLLIPSQTVCKSFIKTSKWWDEHLWQIFPRSSLHNHFLPFSPLFYPRRLTCMNHKGLPYPLASSWVSAIGGGYRRSSRRWKEITVFISLGPSLPDYHPSLEQRLQF